MGDIDMQAPSYTAPNDTVTHNVNNGLYDYGSMKMVDPSTMVDPLMHHDINVKKEDDLNSHHAVNPSDPSSLLASMSMNLPGTTNDPTADNVNGSTSLANSTSIPDFSQISPIGYVAANDVFDTNELYPKKFRTEVVDRDDEVHRAASYEGEIEATLAAAIFARYTRSASICLFIGTIYWRR